MTDVYTVYKDYDNSFIVQLTEDDVPVDLTGISKAAIYYKDTFYDSDAYSDSFDWSLGDGKLEIKLGVISTLPLGRDSAVELIIYDTENPNGIIWGKLYLHVKQIT
jgi:hypothetical protein